MVSEVRFRDILCNDFNFEILSKKISLLMKKDIKLTLISKELPLPFDMVGLQLKYCDLVGFDENKNVYIIELKRSVTAKNLDKTEKQVKEYVDIFKNTIKYILSGNNILYAHKILLKYFEYVKFDYTQINDVIPVIVSISDVEECLFNRASVPFESIGDEILNILLENYIEGKAQHFIETYQVLVPFHDGEIRSDSILNIAYEKLQIDKMKWFPVILNRTNYIGENEETTVISSNFQQISHVYEIVFENVDNYKKIRVDVTDDFEKGFKENRIDQIEAAENMILKDFKANSDNNCKSCQRNELKDISQHFLKIPELYYQFDPEEIFDRISYHSKNSEAKLRFTMQLFRSGRTNPIIYLQLFQNVYISMMQIKPVLLSIGPAVNEVIATDMNASIDEVNNNFYEDVISFETGTYEISLIKNFGVEYYSIKLNGKGSNYEFKVYSPKLKPVEELLPYLTPEKVKYHLDGVIREKGTDYLFKTQKDTTEWITSRIHTTDIY